MIRFHSVFYKAREAFVLDETVPPDEEISNILEEAKTLDGAFAQWEASQIQEWQPKTISQAGFRLSDSKNYCSGRIDSYFDCKCSLAYCWAICLTTTDYVAAVWNTYRKSRLLILEIIVRCKSILIDVPNAQDDLTTALILVEDIIASIPYQLSTDRLSLDSKSNGDMPTILPGKSIGGLLLLHPLWVITATSIVPLEIRARMRECLAWIGLTMGIGQATLLSQV